jgi:hypothetical protein
MSITRGIPTDLKIHIGEFPRIHDFDDCKWDKPAGIYISKTLDRLTEIAENSQEIIIIGKNADLLLAFHLTYLNEKWHLTIIDIAKGDCGG